MSFAIIRVITLSAFWKHFNKFALCLQYLIIFRTAKLLCLPGGVMLLQTRVLLSCFLISRTLSSLRLLISFSKVCFVCSGVLCSGYTDFTVFVSMRIKFVIETVKINHPFMHAVRNIVKSVAWTFDCIQRRETASAALRPSVKFRCVVQNVVIW